MKNRLLIQFEKHTQLGPTYAARLLGYAYPTYAQWRAGSHVMQPHTERYVKALMLLPEDTLDGLIKEYVYGNQT